MKAFFVLFIFPIILLIYPLCQTNQNSQVSLQSNKKQYTADTTYLHATNGKILVNKKLDFKGNVVILPKNCLLAIDSGKIINCILIGNNTSLLAKEKSFRNVKIEGTWKVPLIKASLFEDISNNNLTNLFALSNDNIINTIIIPKGLYYISANSENKDLLKPCSNTNIRLDGLIKLLPNSLTHYSILNITNTHNVSIYGSGSIVGDKKNHVGEEGEWGMGIQIMNSSDILINGISIKSCWGDCLYIGKKSRDVRIIDCNITDGRRQGISITSGFSIYVNNCKIRNISGTPPEDAIDIEPNTDMVVDKVIIDNIDIYNCAGGISITSEAKNSIISNVEIKNCVINKVYKKAPIAIFKCDTITISNNKITAADGFSAISAKRIKEINIRRNKLSSKYTPIIFDRVELINY